MFRFFKRALVKIPFYAPLFAIGGLLYGFYRTEKETTFFLRAVPWDDLMQKGVDWVVQKVRK